MGARRKLLRVSTIPLSLKMFCRELLVELRDEYDVLAVSSPGAELDELASSGIPVHSIKMERAISPVSDLKSLWQLFRLFRQYKPDIVHSLTPKAGLLSMIAAKLAGVPVRIHSFTGLIFPTATGLKKTILKTTDRVTCACATHVLPEGQGVKSDLIEAKITKKTLRVLGNGNLRGIDLEYYNINEDIRSEAKLIANKYGIADGDFVFVFVGRVVNDKGISELIEAFSRLVTAYHRCHLVLVGPEEPMEDPLNDATKRLLSETKNIHFTNQWVEDVRPYYAMADAFVFPSYREGFPNVVIEAGAMGLPSIVTDINGSREIISEGVNGTIIPVRDCKSLYDAMETFVVDSEQLRQLASNCRAIIAEKYEARYVRSCVKEFYRSLQ